MGYFVPLLFLAVVAAASADTAPLALPPGAHIELQQPVHAAVIAEVGQPSPVVRPRRDPQFGGGSQASSSAQSGSFGFGPFQGSFASSQSSSGAVAGGGGFGGGGFGGGHRPGYGHGGRPGYGHGRPGYGHGGGHYHGHGGGHYHGHGGGHHHGGGFHRRGFF